MRIVLLALLLTLSACGFHLRGQVPLSSQLSSVYLDAQQPNSAFSKLITRQLQYAKVNVSQTPGKSPVILNIINENWQSNERAISATTLERQRILTFTVDYQLLTNKGQVIVPPAQASAHRSLIMNANRLLGSTREEQTNRTEMEHEVVQKIITRLASPGIKQKIEAHFAN